MANSEQRHSGVLTPSCCCPFVSCLLTRTVLAALCFLAVALLQPQAVPAALASPQTQGSHYTVRKGDTLSAIARRHGLSVASLKSLNGLSSDRIKPKQTLILYRQQVVAAPAEEPLPVGLQSVVEKYLNTPYRFGGTGQDGIDCSAFVQKVFLELDVDLPRSAREQYWYGEEIAESDLHSGDLLFFRTYAQYPSHVGIYLGDGKMVHASARSRRVVSSDINQPYYRKRFIGAKRFATIASSLDLSTLDAEIEDAEEEESLFVPIETIPLPNAAEAAR